jgi:hypothetical protein
MYAGGGKTRRIQQSHFSMDNQASRDTGQRGRLVKEGTIEVPPDQFTAIPFSVGKKINQEAVGTEASSQMGCLYWLLTVQNIDEIPSG